jgi:hypothetical protein
VLISASSSETSPVRWTQPTLSTSSSQSIRRGDEGRCAEAERLRWSPKAFKAVVSSEAARFGADRDEGLGGSGQGRLRVDDDEEGGGGELELSSWSRSMLSRAVAASRGGGWGWSKVEAERLAVMPEDAATVGVLSVRLLVAVDVIASTVRASGE